MYYSNLNAIVYASSNTTGESSRSHHQLGSLVVRGAGGVSIGNSAGELIISGGAGPGGGGSVNFSAGTTSGNLDSVVFSNGNGVSFGLNGSTITATVQTNFLTTAALSNHSHGVTANNGGFNFQTLSLSNANGISFGTSAGSAITASHNALTSQSGQAFSADASSTFQTLTLQDSNGISFSNNAGAIRLTHALQFTSNTSAITSAALHTSAALRAIYDGANSISTGTIRFTNANGVSFSINGQTISGSVAAQSNQQMTMFATGNTTLSSTGTSNASSLIFRGSGAASVGITNGSVLIDVAAGAAAITQSIGMSTQTAGGATAGTTGYATGDDVLYHFVPGSNITMSQSINGASGTLSIYGPSAGGGATLSYWYPAQAISVGGSSALSNTCTFVPMALEQNVSFSQIAFPASISLQTTTNTSSCGLAVGISFVLYTRDVSTLRSFNSGSASMTSFHQSNSSTVLAGVRLLSAPLATATLLTPGRYWMAFHFSTTSTAQLALNKSISMCVAPAWTVAGVQHFTGGASVNTRGPIDGGPSILATAATRASIAFTDMTGFAGAAGSNANLWYILRNETVW